jgi:hypothetical protein
MSLFFRENLIEISCCALLNVERASNEVSSSYGSSIESFSAPPVGKVKLIAILAV